MLKWKSFIHNAFQSLRQNLKRTLLTMFGIVVGVSSVIVIFSLGDGFQKYTIRNLTKTESTEISMEVVFIPNSTDFSVPDTLFKDDIQIIREIEGISNAEITNHKITDFAESIEIGKYFPRQIVQLKSSTQLSLISGKNISLHDNMNLAKTALISTQTAEMLGNNNDEILGKGISIKDELYTVVGIFDKQTLFDSVDVIIPERTYNHYSNRLSNTMTLKFFIQKNYNPTEISNKVIKKLTDFGAFNSLGSYEILNVSDIIDGIGKVFSAITYFITGIAGISLFIAGVSVMNMIYISVSERAQEIGIRRTVGATETDIRNQFLIEGIFITSVAGTVGYMFGTVLAMFIGMFLPFQIIPSLTIAIFTIIGTIIWGLLFSLLPANHASKQEIIKNLK